MSVSKSMIKGKPAGLMIRFAVPLMIGSFFQLFYNIADSIIVGRLLGVEAFAAVSAAGTFYWLILSMISGLTQGFGTVIAQCFGSRDKEKTKKAFAMSIALAVIIGIVFSALSTLFTNPVLVLLKTPQDIIDGTTIYLSYMFSGLLLPIFSYIFSSAFFAVGNSKIPLQALIVACILNIALDIILVGFTPLGVAGAAIATLIAQLFSCVYCISKLRKLSDLKLSKCHFLIDFIIIKELLRIGTPRAISEFILSLGGIVIQYYINLYGVIYIAGISAAKKIYSIMAIVAGGMEGAVATYVAQNYGAKRLDRIKSGVRTAFLIMMTGVTLIIIVLLLSSRWIAGLFISGSPEEVNAVLDVAVKQVRIMLIFLPTVYLLFLFRSALQGVGNVIFTFISGFLEMAARILSVLILPAFIGEWGIFIAEIAGWPLCALMLFIAYISVFRQKSKLPEFKVTEKV